ncbi:glycosyl transferase [Gemella sp. GH3]|uniref:beta-1,6-N-acetylglucosaminyltransferase n=1 Tax=unclassified Gemella TaxID=2624949 RepID=UPI0015D0A79C|nr:MULTISPECIES: beta-1,6-N-acetylglucosaminyltransferase [unclassified Gemella]MBF0713650.1 glycosyl transferase [Gemella sp. GH3.1]NYS50602.1 glycosyl transferase [Gemella sp. GH3]
MKQAYLIIAHNKFEQLKYLIECLDNINNDIYIFVDKKSNISEDVKGKIKNTPKFSNLYFTKRIPVYWGTHSQIDAELILFEESFEKNKYSYYHLLSGVDLPLQNSKYIYKFFDNNPNKIFITNVADNIYYENKIYRRIKYKHLFPNLSERRFNSSLLQFFIRKYRRLEEVIQKICNVDYRKKYNIGNGYASNWLSLDEETVDLLVKDISNIKKIYKNTLITDELFIPIFIKKHNLEYKIYHKEKWNGFKGEFQGNLRYINWWDGSPHTWTDSKEDINQLEYAIETGHLFSRKFDLEKYPKLKEYIATKIK